MGLEHGSWCLGSCVGLMVDQFPTSATKDFIAFPRAAVDAVRQRPGLDRGAVRHDRPVPDVLRGARS